ncbi:hypothetical protein O5Y_13310 [Rhodococcus erythropolis CCM2595]|uniref:hypothetical protein n=1 Tax=Rhodococcus erythropolis TaxID=1833 RepID=UPI00038DCF3D|nr:hypothetical protein [Rhodococcus erythropolis]AGT92517.1 hypothetical protein O5Y_13310 [Rhodococcus erythropolis CCM2595]MQP31338.1 hypothetical protein [Rhodococcus erythropolis]SUE13141.1 Uncharacterised protein [Rhodococcus erythropolis]
MKIRFELMIGILLVVGGGCLWLFARDAEFFWFHGGPLGVILAIIGAFDIVNAVRTRETAIPERRND